MIHYRSNKQPWRLSCDLKDDDSSESRNSTLGSSVYLECK